MSTANDIITYALKRATLLGSDETASAEDAADTLAMLNDMMHGWKASGVDTLHETMVLADTFPLDDMFVQGVKAMLTLRLCDDFGKTPTALTIRDAQDGWDALMVNYSPVDRLHMDAGLTQMPSQGGRSGAMTQSRWTVGS